MRKILYSIVALVVLVALAIILWPLAQKNLKHKTQDNNQNSNSNNNQNNSDNSQSGINYRRIAQSCQEGNSFTEFAILMDGKDIGHIKTENCESSEIEFLEGDQNQIYFSALPGGLGGYILYGRYTNLYRFTQTNNAIEVIPLNLHNLTDMDFSANLDQVAFYRQSANATNPKIVVYNLSTKQTKEYDLPVSATNAQFGSFKFSSNEEPTKAQLAFAVGFGPTNEHGQIYKLNLDSSTYKKYLDTKTPPIVMGWKDENNLGWTERTNIKFYTSSKLKISFNYFADQDGDNKVDVVATEKGDKVFLAGITEQPEQGQWVQKFNKDQNDNLAAAIKKLFNLSDTDCKVNVLDIGNSRQIATIGILGLTTGGLDDPKFSNNNCPAEYRETNGIRYFYYDTKHNDQFYFFSIGQYAILGYPGYRRAWQDTISIQ